MNDKINVADILRHKPQGTKLYDRSTGLIVCFDNISTTDGETVIWCTRSEDSVASHFSYSEFGTMRGYPDGIVLLVPSKYMQDWAEYQKMEFKDGDIVFISEKLHDYRAVVVFRGFEHGRPTTYATLFLNENIVHIKDSDKGYSIFCSADRVKEIRPASESEKKRLFDALAERGKRWNAETKRIEDLPNPYEFKPFDRVLVRDEDDEAWRIGIFSHMAEGCSAYPYCVISAGSCSWAQCIPYEGNEHLLGTSDSPK